VSATEVQNATGDATVGRVDLKLEVQIIPVSDVDRAKEFYQRVGFRIDSDVAPLEGLRIVQTTPPGSGTSVNFGVGITTAEPGSSEAGLIVSDIEAAHHELAGRGIEVSDIWHGPPFPVEARQPGVDPERGSYMSFFSFTDPDGNTWLVQEVTARAPGRIAADKTGYASRADLASALRRAESAYDAKHKEHLGGLIHRHPQDEGRADWYASYMVAEQAGTDPPA
jgi:catechol 2,3-dioxygenase-like lactoylglutathione lyase family enzyme